jgi:hypothetical protein
MPEVVGICPEREVSPASRWSTEKVDKACGIPAAAVDTEKEFEEVA